MTDDSPKIIPFGKYKGRMLDEVLADDPGYLQWLCGQDWFRAKFNILHQVIINRGAEPEETPEHNAMQVKFLDDEFCTRFVEQSVGKAVRAALQHCRTGTTEYKIEELKTKKMYMPSESEVEQRTKQIKELENQLAQLLAEPLGNVTFRFERQFESGGVDVVLLFVAESIHYNLRTEPWTLWPHDRDGCYQHRGLAIEIKPVIGDDYPAVLRQMKRTGSNVLFVGEYIGTGATEAQFIKTMATAGIRVVFLRDVEAT